MRYFIFILLILTTILAGCNPETSTETSTENRVNNFTFVEDTLNPGLTEATYKIEHRSDSDTGLIYSKDSLRFGTRLDSVVPFVTFKATPGSATYFLPNDTVISTGSDTLDFTQMPVYLHVLASDMKTERWYRIDIHAHKVNPDLYVWAKLADEIFPKQNCETKAFYIQNQFILYVNNGLNTTVYKSSDAIAWGKTSTPSNLPTPCHVKDIVQHNDTLFYIDKQQLYTTTNCIDWTATDYSSATFEPINMLLTYNKKIWCLIQDRSTAKLMLATIQNGHITPQTNIVGINDGFLPSNFPISDFAATSFDSSSERPRAMIVGGRSINGEPINTRWNLEYVTTNDTYRLRDFTISQPTFHTLTGASIVQYGGQLIMFGGIDNDAEWNTDILYSDDEGMHWYQPDTASNKMPADYQSRQNQSVIINQNSVYVIGGQSTSTSFSDVYRGRLNSLQ